MAVRFYSFLFNMWNKHKSTVHSDTIETKYVSFWISFNETWGFAILSVKIQTALKRSNKIILYNRFWFSAKTFFEEKSSVTCICSEILEDLVKNVGSASKSGIFESIFRTSFCKSLMSQRSSSRSSYLGYEFIA